MSCSTVKNDIFISSYCLLFSSLTVRTSVCIPFFALSPFCRVYIKEKKKVKS